MEISFDNLKKNEDYFKSSPIYFLTRNIELSKLHSILCGNQSAFGTYIEKQLKSFIFEKGENIFKCNFKEYKKIQKGIYINKDKPLIENKLPDLIILNADTKIITNAEIKIRADRSDGKKILADIEGNKKIKNYLKTQFPTYTIENIVVSLYKPQGSGNIDVWKKYGAYIVFGEDFLKNYFNLNFIDFENKLNKYEEVNNKRVLNQLHTVLKATENKILKKDFLNNANKSNFFE
jgi:hypothetical protein